MAETAEDHIARLEEPRRTEIRRLHELIRAAAPGLETSAGERMLGSARTTRKIGKSCVRFRRTSDLDLDALSELVSEAARIGPPSAV